MFSKQHKSSVHVAGIFCLLLLAYHRVFHNYFPLPNGRMGHDYILTLGSFFDGYLWFRNNGFFSPPWFTPSFCGGQALFADPQSAFYSVPQFLTFFIDPVQAVYWSNLVFASLGFWGMYFFCRVNLASNRLSGLIAATVFMFNGFYSHRMIIGHYGYQSFMLAPLIAYLLLKIPDRSTRFPTHLLNALLAGLLIAYWFHSGLTTLIIPAALAVVTLACLAATRDQENIAKTFLLRGLLASLLAIGLSASKLNANLSLMGNFSRDYYPLPGIADVVGLLTFVFQSLFYSSEHAYETVTPLWQNMQWAAMPHELAFGLTPLPLVVLLIAGGAQALSKTSPRILTRLTGQAAIALLLLILPIPLALLYYSPEWNTTLKNLPLIDSTTSPYRWLIIYIPLLAALTGLVSHVEGKLQKILACIILLGIPLLNALETRDYYQQQGFNPAPFINSYHAIRQGKLEPGIQRIADPRHENGEPKIDNTLFLQGSSPMRCYNPLYGYRLEKIKTTPLKPGPIDTLTAKDSLNMHNPACLLFPAENHCTPWDAFQPEQRDELTKFANYHPYTFEKSERQHTADIVTESSIGLLLLLTLLAVIRRSRPLLLSLNTDYFHTFRMVLTNSSAIQTGSTLVATALFVFLITRWITPDGLTEDARKTIKETFVTWAYFFQPEARERAAYLLTITLFPTITSLLTLFIYRGKLKLANKVSAHLSVDHTSLTGTWLFFLLICWIVGSAMESPFGSAFGFFDYTPIRVLFDMPQPLVFFLLTTLTSLLCYRSLFTHTTAQASPYRILINYGLDAAAICLILFVAARISFIPEDTGALNWAPDLIHMAPIFETAATAYLSQATAGANLTSQYGGLVEFARPLLWLMEGDPLAMMWFAYLALTIACFCQWLAVRKLTGNAFLSLLTVGALFYFTSIKFANFACFQCVNFRWFWPSIFLCLAAFFGSSKMMRFIPYCLFPIAIYWNPESGLAACAAWVGWRLLANLLPIAVWQDRKALASYLKNNLAYPVAGAATGILLVMSYVALKSGKLLDFGLMSLYAKDFYLYGFYMLPMPAFHLWNVYVVVTAMLLTIGIRQYAANAPCTSENSKQGFIIFACLLFSLLFSYYQGRSYYGNLLIISYPLLLALSIWLQQIQGKITGFKQALTAQPLQIFFTLLLCIGFSASLSTRFYLPAVKSPFTQQNIEEKAELKSWVEKTAKGRIPLFISFSAWRLMLITGVSHGTGTVPLAALLRRDQLDSYIRELKKPGQALYYDESNDLYFKQEHTFWAEELKHEISGLSAGSELFLPKFSNNQGRLILLNPD